MRKHKWLHGSSVEKLSSVSTSQQLVAAGTFGIFQFAYPRFESVSVPRAPLHHSCSPRCPPPGSTVREPTLHR